MNSLSSEELLILREESPALYIRVLEKKIATLEAEKNETDSYVSAISKVHETRMKQKDEKIASLLKQVDDLNAECSTFSRQFDILSESFHEYKNMNEMLRSQTNGGDVMVDQEIKDAMTKASEMLEAIVVDDVTTTDVVAAAAAATPTPTDEVLTLATEETTAVNAVEADTTTTTSGGTSPISPSHPWGFNQAFNTLFSKLFRNQHDFDQHDFDQQDFEQQDFEQYNSESFDITPPVNTTKVSGALVSFYSRILSNPNIDDNIFESAERNALLAELQDLEIENDDDVDTSTTVSSEDDDEVRDDDDDELEDDKNLVDKQLAELVSMFDMESLGITVPKSVVSAGHAVSTIIPSSDTTDTATATDTTTTTLPSMVSFPSKLFNPNVTRLNNDIFPINTPVVDLPNRGRSRDNVILKTSTSSSTPRPESRSRSRSRGRLGINLSIVPEVSAPAPSTVQLKYVEDDPNILEINQQYKKKAAHVLGRDDDAELERKISEKLQSIKSLIHDKKLEKDQEHIVGYFEAVFQQHVDVKMRDKAKIILDNQKKIVFGDFQEKVEYDIVDDHSNGSGDATTTTQKQKQGPTKIVFKPANDGTMNSITPMIKETQYRGKRVFYAINDDDVPNPNQMNVEVKLNTPIRETFFEDLRDRGFSSNPDLRTPEGRPWPRVPFTMKGDYLTADDIIDNLKAQRQLEDDEGLRSNIIDKLVLMGMDKRYEYLVRREFEKYEIKETEAKSSFDRAAQFVADKLFGYK